MEVTTFLHPFKAGDLIAMLPGVKHLYETTGKKARIYQRLGMPSYFAEQRTEQCMGLATYLALKPLLEAQEYIESYRLWEGEPVDIDVSLSRDSEAVGLPYGSIHHWTWALIPEMQCNLFLPWLHIDVPIEMDSFMRDKIVINRTTRYRNRYITYYFLYKYRDQLLFAGLPHELEEFCSEFNLNIPIINANNFLEMAGAIQTCKLFLGNQSAFWHIADAMKSPRLLEASPDYPNTFPTGANGYFFLHQKSLEVLFEKLTA